MRRRNFPPLHADVTELALGTWGLSGEGYGSLSPAESDAVIDRALGLGVNLFETADCYEMGQTLVRLGRRLASMGPGRTFVVTRIGVNRSDPTQPKKNFEPEALRTAVSQSIDGLKRDRVDVVLLHNPGVPTVERGEATGALEEMRQSGLIGAWGVSAGSREVALAAIEAGTNVLSVTYNLFRSHDLSAVAAEVAMRGVAVLAHSVLAYGLLSCHWGPDRTFEEGDHRRDRWTPSDLRKRVQQLEVVRNLVGGDVLTPRAAALRFVLSNSLITSAVIGPRSTAQLEQLVREAGKGPPYLPDKVLADLPSQLISVGIHT